MIQSMLPSPKAADRSSLDIASGLYHDRFHQQIDRSAIRDINRTHGTDVATALLYLHFNHQLHDGLAIDHALEPRPWMIAIVPGAFYKQHPEIGADGRQIAALAAKKGWRCEMIPVESLGTLRSNARTIAKFVDERSNQFQVIAVSLSKGTTDMMAALRSEPRITESIKAWISISGVTSGTLMADWLLDRWRLRPIMHLMCWKHSADRQAIVDLRHHTDLDFDDFRQIPTVHVAGFPLQRHLSHWRSRLWHRRIRPCGPNDSVVLLETLLDIPGNVLPVWGVDHYLKSTWDVSLLMETLINRLRACDSDPTEPLKNHSE